MIPAGRPLGPLPPSAVPATAPEAKHNLLLPQAIQSNSIKVGRPERLTILDRKTTEENWFASKSLSHRGFSTETKRPERLVVITRIKVNENLRYPHESVG